MEDFNIITMPKDKEIKSSENANYILMLRIDNIQPEHCKMVETLFVGHLSYNDINIFCGPMHDYILVYLMPNINSMM